MKLYVTKERTYLSVREHLNSHSMFSGRDPLVSKYFNIFVLRVIVYL